MGFSEEEEEAGSIAHQSTPERRGTVYELKLEPPTVKKEAPRRGQRCEKIVCGGVEDTVCFSQGSSGAN